MSCSLQTDEFLEAVGAVLIAAAGVPELIAKNVIVWQHGTTDPDEDIAASIGKTGGVSVLIYDLGGDATDDVLTSEAAVELYVATTKRNRRADPTLRVGSQIRNSIMRALHRNAELQNLAPYFDCRVIGYTPLDDGEFSAWRITITHTIYLADDE